MGKKKKSRTQRLPPSERTLVGSKVSSRVFPSATAAAAAAVASSSTGGTSKCRESNSELSALSCNIKTTLRISEKPSAPLCIGADSSTPGRIFRSVELDDDVLRRIFRHAGVLAVLSATRVNRTWRRVALQELSETKRLNMTDALCRGRVTLSPSYEWFPRTIHSFPNLNQLSLALFPYPELLPELASYVLTRIASATIQTLDLSGLDFTAVDIHSLIVSGRLPSLQNLILTQCSSVNGELTKQLANALVASKTKLNSVDMSNCGRLDASSLGPLLTRDVVNNVIVKKCINVKRIVSNMAITSLSVNLHGCQNLGRFHVVAAYDCLKDLNLSQNKSLASLQLIPQQGSELAIRTLNLASCPLLRDISFGSEACGLPHVEELLLAGARNIHLNVFERTLGLSSAQCAMPKLRRLELVDTQIRELRLIGYGCLEIVNAAGCGDLNRIQVHDVPRLEKLSFASQKAPLSMVYLDVPRSTKILGRRREWSWQKLGTRQVVEYGFGGNGGI